jgi:RNA polymerase sigma-B factor
MRSLPARERRILVRRVYGDRTPSEIAERIGISQMHVSRLLAKSLELLRDHAGDGEPELAKTSPTIETEADDMIPTRRAQ